MEKKQRKMLTSFTILVLMILALAVLSWIVSAAVPDSGVAAATFADIVVLKRLGHKQKLNLKPIMKLPKLLRFFSSYISIKSTQNLCTNNIHPF